MPGRVLFILRRAGAFTTAAIGQKLIVGAAWGFIVDACPVRAGPGNGAVLQRPIYILYSATLAVSACTP